MNSDACELCELVDTLQADGKLFKIGTDWTLNHYQGPGSRPRFVIQSRRHTTGLDDLGLGELGSLGRALGRAVRVIKREPAVERVYVMSFNETDGGHTHVHLVPRFLGETELGPGLSNEAEAPGFDVNRVIRRISTINGAAVTDSYLVTAARTTLDFWNRRLSAYRLIQWLADSNKRMIPDAGEVYVTSWLVMLALATLGVSWLSTDEGSMPLPAWAAVTVTILAAYRLIDIATYTLRILLTTYRTALASVARSLLLFILNLVELTMIGYLLLVASGVAVGEAVPHAIAITTSLGGVESELPSLAVVSLVAVNIVTLMIFALGISMLVGKIGESFTDLSVSRSSNE